MGRGMSGCRVKGRVMASVLRARARRGRLRVAALLAAATLLTLTVPLRAVAADDTDFEQQVLFKASQDPGYSCFRIPAIVKSARGTLLAFAEGRVNNCGDAGDIDL